MWRIDQHCVVGGTRYGAFVTSSEAAGCFGEESVDIHSTLSLGQNPSHLLGPALSACPYSCWFWGLISILPKACVRQQGILEQKEQEDLWGRHWTDVWWGPGGPWVLTMEGAGHGETKKRLLSFKLPPLALSVKESLALCVLSSQNKGTTAHFLRTGNDICISG